MQAAIPIFVLGCLAASDALAEACHVIAQPTSTAVEVVAEELCYEFIGMDDDALDWACSNQPGAMIERRQQLVASCATGSAGRCDAALTQATLRNYRAFDDDRGKPRPAVPNDAKVITHYYRSDNLEQLRIDCESSGGTWQEEP
ncbi:hypothetical protein ACSVIJ_25280 [Pseudomonas sp. NCHU5208]|uniref:hypothetical protein n=1 Tax=unclassified Pseudomonas TaxID=196821 RepID=UPI003F97D882